MLFNFFLALFFIILQFNFATFFYIDVLQSFLIFIKITFQFLLYFLYNFLRLLF